MASSNCFRLDLIVVKFATLVALLLLMNAPSVIEAGSCECQAICSDGKPYRSSTNYDHDCGDCSTSLCIGSDICGAIGYRGGAISSYCDTSAHMMSNSLAGGVIAAVCIGA